MEAIKMCCGKTAKGLLVPWPPREVGKLFRVIYVIDVGATSARQAAQETYRLMTDPNSMRPIMQVLETDGNFSTIDLAKEVLHEKHSR
jgi:hypothetical protein